MIRFFILLAVLFGIALGFHQLKGTSGEVTMTVNGTAYVVELTTAVIGLIALVVAALVIFLVLRAIFGAPGSLARRWRQRNEERGREAISQGLIAIASGEQRSAERAALEAARRAPGQPLTLLLQAQAAQLRGDRAAARQSFEAMAADDRTRVAGLRGLYIEAEREGASEAAWRFAEQAQASSRTTPWAARAVLQHQSAAGDWEDALRTLSSAADHRVIDKRVARRQRAVLLTALALAREDGDPDGARAAALEAHDLASDLVPAAVVAGRLLSRTGDVRRATKVLEATWKAMPHPEVADAYAHVRAGDSALDRLKRMETLHRLKPQADEGRLAVARAAIDARDFDRARDALKPVLTTRPTQNALFLMADLVEAETGDHGQAREWLARAVRAPRDPVWTADGMVLEQWAPVSPVSGRIDAVEWKVPLAELEAPSLQIDEAAIRPPEPPIELAPAEPKPEKEPEAAPEAEEAKPAAAEPPKPAPAPAATGPNGRDKRAAATEIIGPPAHEAADAPEEVGAVPPPPVLRMPDDPGVEDEPEEEEVKRVRIS